MARGVKLKNEGRLGGRLALATRDAQVSSGLDPSCLSAPATGFLRALEFFANSAVKICCEREVGKGVSLFGRSRGGRSRRNGPPQVV